MKKNAWNGSCRSRGLILEKFNVPVSVCNPVRNHGFAYYVASDGGDYKLDMIVRGAARLTHSPPFPDGDDKPVLLSFSFVWNQFFTLFIDFICFLW